jgi:hypothetical protein
MSPTNIATTRRAKALAFEVPKPTLSADVAEEILKSTNTEIVQGIKERRWTSTEVLSAFVARAVAAQEATNCLTEGEPVESPNCDVS